MTICHFVGDSARIFIYGWEPYWILHALVFFLTRTAEAHGYVGGKAFKQFIDRVPLTSIFVG